MATLKEQLKSKLEAKQMKKPKRRKSRKPQENIEENTEESIDENKIESIKETFEKKDSDPSIALKKGSCYTGTLKLLLGLLSFFLGILVVVGPSFVKTSPGSSPRHAPVEISQKMDQDGIVEIIGILPGVRWIQNKVRPIKIVEERIHQKSEKLKHHGIWENKWIVELRSRASDMLDTYFENKIAPGKTAEENTKNLNPSILNWKNTKSWKDLYLEGVEVVSRFSTNSLFKQAVIEKPPLMSSTQVKTAVERFKSSKFVPYLQVHTGGTIDKVEKMLAGNGRPYDNNIPWAWT